MQVHTKLWPGIAAESIQFTSNKQEGKREKVKRARGHFQRMKEQQRSGEVSYLQMTGGCVEGSQEDGESSREIEKETEKDKSKED